MDYGAPYRPLSHENSTELLEKEPSYYQPASSNVASLQAENLRIPSTGSPDLVNITVPLSTLLELDQEEHQRYVLQQAALALEVPYQMLLGLSEGYQCLSERIRRGRRAETTTGDTFPAKGGLTELPINSERIAPATAGYGTPAFRGPRPEEYVEDLSGQRTLLSACEYHPEEYLSYYNLS